MDNYAYNEIGFLQGIVSMISKVPNKNTYSINVQLNNGLVTTYKKTLTFNEDMKGKAEIIIKNISIMDKIFFNLNK